MIGRIFAAAASASNGVPLFAAFVTLAIGLLTGGLTYLGIQQSKKKDASTGVREDFNALRDELRKQLVDEREERTAPVSSQTAPRPGWTPRTSCAKYAAAVGDGSLTTIDVTHSLATTDITYSLRLASTGEIVETDALVLDANTLCLTLASAPASGEYRAVVHG